MTLLGLALLCSVPVGGIAYMAFDFVRWVAFPCNRYVGLRR